MLYWVTVRFCRFECPLTCEPNVADGSDSGRSPTMRAVEGTHTFRGAVCSHANHTQHEVGRRKAFGPGSWTRTDVGSIPITRPIP